MPSPVKSPTATRPVIGPVANAGIEVVAERAVAVAQQHAAGARVAARRDHVGLPSPLRSPTASSVEVALTGVPYGAQAAKPPWPSPSSTSTNRAVPLGVVLADHEVAVAVVVEVRQPPCRREGPVIAVRTGGWKVPSPLPSSTLTCCQLLEVDHRQVEIAVVVEVGGHRATGPARRRSWLAAPNPPLAVAEQHADGRRRGRPWPGRDGRRC